MRRRAKKLRSSYVLYAQKCFFSRVSLPRTLYGDDVNGNVHNNADGGLMTQSMVANPAMGRHPEAMTASCDPNMLNNLQKVKIAT